MSKKFQITIIVTLMVIGITAAVAALVWVGYTPPQTAQSSQSSSNTNSTQFIASSRSVRSSRNAEVSEIKYNGGTIVDNRIQSLKLEVPEFVQWRARDEAIRINPVDLSPIAADTIVFDVAEGSGILGTLTYAKETSVKEICTSAPLRIKDDWYQVQVNSKPDANGKVSYSFMYSKSLKKNDNNLDCPYSVNPVNEIAGSDYKYLIIQSDPDISDTASYIKLFALIAMQVQTK
jgi:hypothetical protein